MHTQQQLFDLPELARRLPCSVGARPSEKGVFLTYQDFSDIAQRSISQGQFYREGHDLEWTTDPSFQASLLFQTFLQGPKLRESGGKLDLTHPEEVAYEVRFSRELLKRGHDPARLAFVPVSHDADETSQKLGHLPGQANDFLMSHCWLGDPGLAQAIHKDLSDLTDPSDLSGQPRLDNQAARILTMSDISRFTRVNDKLNLVENDAAARRAGRMDDDDMVIKRATQAGLKFDLILRAHKLGDFPDGLIHRYATAARYLELQARDIFQRRERQTEREEAVLWNPSRRHIFRIPIDVARAAGVIGGTTAAIASSIKHLRP